VENIAISKYFNHPELDVGSYLLTCIFDRAWRDMVDVRDWARDKSKEVKGTLRVLEWLGLVEPDKSSHLGVKPTHVLMSVVMARGNQNHTLKRPPSNREECTLYGILGTALGERDRQKLQESVCKVLHVFGLVNACPANSGGLLQSAPIKTAIGGGSSFLSCENQHPTCRTRSEKR
jgi:hypothetical protein